MTRRHPSEEHTTWCAKGHRCGLGEHRATPVTVAVPGAGSIVLTRVLTASGAHLAEIRLSIVLPDREDHARARLTALLTHLQVLIGPARGAAGRPNRKAA